MQNTNEHRIILPTSNEYTNSNSDIPISIQTNSMELDLPEMALPNDQSGEIIHSGYRSDNLSGSQVDKQIDEKILNQEADLIKTNQDYEDYQNNLVNQED